MAKKITISVPREHTRGYTATPPPKEKGGNQGMNPTPPPSPPKTSK